ncbi:hypothetical protein [Staphylococcus epidermidis]|uniref:hypothetical protein n=1 Tax=Staphylococcus epidermidis TaxID=1282 RepID=UPI00301A5E11
MKLKLKYASVLSLGSMIASTLICMLIMKVKLNRMKDVYDAYKQVGLPIKETVNTNVHRFWDLLQITLSDGSCILGILFIGFMMFLLGLNYKVFSY